MKTFNYRVLAFKEPDDNIFFQVHEVYNNNNVPYGYSQNGAIICGSNKKELELTYNTIFSAFKKPILWGGEDFPKQYKKPHNGCGYEIGWPPLNVV